MRTQSQATGRYQGAWVGLRRPMDCPDPEVTMLRRKITTALIVSASAAARSSPYRPWRPRPHARRTRVIRRISVGDVQGILTGKTTINHYSMSESNPGEGCSLGVTGNGWAFVDISIRQGDLQAFQTLLFFAPKSRKSVAGVGDEAFGTPTKDSNVPNAKETDLWARKGKLQCIVELHRSNGDGEKLVVPTTDGAIAAKLGGLCNKLFAARGGS
jgi:hypothetical protein